MYNKSKKFGLSDDEKLEQEKLRREYVKIIRGNFENQLKNYKKKDDK